MNYLRLLGLISQLAAISSGAPRLKGDRLAYYATRQLAEQFERRNPGIADDTGFAYPIISGND